MNMIAELTAEELKEKLVKEPDLTLIDVRQPKELQLDAPIEGALNIPMTDIEANLAEIPKDKPFVVYCQKGGRSMQVVGLLNASGYQGINLVGGIEAWQSLTQN